MIGPGVGRLVADALTTLARLQVILAVIVLPAAHVLLLVEA